MTGIGGAEGDRTPDLYNAIVALSQLSYGPNFPTHPCTRSDAATPLLPRHTRQQKPATGNAGLLANRSRRKKFFALQTRQTRSFTSQTRLSVLMPTLISLGG